MPDLIGKTLGPYRIISQIGLGGMATVYKAYQPSMDRYVALKVLSTHFAQDPGFIKRFQQEAKIIARLEHARILPVYDHGEEDGYLYLVMRYIEAGTLKDRLKQKPLPLEEARRVVAQVGSALDYAHQLGVIHRDIKPSNVLVDPQGDCYLTDFGIAKMIEGTLGLTGSGIIGTPHYMAPEQTKSLAVDHRADVYAMGVVIYEMVTGQLPYDAETPLAVAIKHMTEPLPLPRSIRPDLPEAVERVILKALAKDPADRYQSMRDLAAAFEQAVQTAPTVVAPRSLEKAPAPVSAPTVRVSRRPAWQPWLAARPIWQWGLTALVVVALVIAGITLSQVQRAPVAGMARPLATSTAAAVGIPPATVVPPAALATVAPGAASKPTLSLADQARTFAGPILAAIANRQPDYQDDFGDPGSGWPVGSSSEGDRWGYDNHAYVIAATYLPKIQGGCCIGVTPEHGPQLGDFVLDVQVHFVSSEEGLWQVVFRQSPPTADQGGGYSVGFRPDGQFRVSKNVRGLHTDLEAGRYVPAFRPGYDVNRLTIVARGPRIAIYVNQEPVWLIEDSSISKGGFTLGVENMSATGKLLQAQFDNLRIWDIASVPVAAPAPRLQGEQIRALAEPLLKAIADKPPDYQDDFGNPRSGWWQVESADKGKSGYADGEFFMITDPPTLSPGWQCNVATGPWPKVTDLVLEADMRLVSGKQVSSQIQFRVWDRPVQQQGGAYVVTFDGEGFGLLRCQDKGCPNLSNYSGSAIRRGTEWNHIQIIARGGRVVVYVNGEPAMYFEDSNDSQDFRSGRVNLTECNMSNAPLEARWDNLRIWDISRLLGPASPPAPDPAIAQARAFGDPILKTVANKPPEYQDNFGNSKSGWPQVGVMGQGRFGYVDGEYSIVANAAYPSPVACNGVNAPVRELSDFVLEFDGRFALGKGGNAIMAFRQWEMVGKGRGGYELHFSRPNETADLRRCDSKECATVVDYFGNATKTSTEWNHWQIMAQGSKLAVYVNREPILYLDDNKFTLEYGSGRFELKVCNVADVPSDVRWDNLKIWNISK